MIYDVIIIGGGASGLLAAATIKNKKVLLIEGNKKFGKKLLATGNGRCNLSNLNMDINKYHGDISLLKPYFEGYNTERVISAFQNLALKTKADEEGRLYPLNLQAQAVNECLLRGIENNNTQVILEFTAEKVSKTKGVFSVFNEKGEEYKGKNLIFAVGGLASGKLSCKNKSYDIIKSFGHNLSPLSPSIVQFICKDKFINTLQGVRAKAEVTLISGDKKIRKEAGEVQFTEKCLSGIAVMQLSSECSGLINPDFTFKEKSFIELDLLPDMSFSEVFLMLKDFSKIKGITCENLLKGVLNIKLAKEIINKSGLPLEKGADKLKDGELKALVSLIKGLKLSISGLKGFEDAQVTSGGVKLKEVNLETMESKLVKGLYFTGEVLNIHGDCGGYNLHFAFVTALKAAESLSL